MENHSCYIGILYYTDYSELVTKEQLQRSIRAEMKLNQSIDEDPLFRNEQWLKHKIYTMTDYADGRKNTNLRRFNFCPGCGKPLNDKGRQIQKERLDYGAKTAVKSV